MAHGTLMCHLLLAFMELVAACTNLVQRNLRNYSSGRMVRTGSASLSPFHLSEAAMLERRMRSFSPRRLDEDLARIAPRSGRDPVPHSFVIGPAVKSIRFDHSHQSIRFRIERQVGEKILGLPRCVALADTLAGSAACHGLLQSES